MRIVFKTHVLSLKWQRLQQQKKKCQSDLNPPKTDIPSNMQMNTHVFCDVNSWRYSWVRPQDSTFLFWSTVVCRHIALNHRKTLKRLLFGRWIDWTLVKSRLWTISSETNTSRTPSSTKRNTQLHFLNKIKGPFLSYYLLNCWRTFRLARDSERKKANLKWQ